MPPAVAGSNPALSIQMTENNPIAEAEQTDNYFDDGSTVLHEAYLILYDYGYSHDDLAPLRHLINETTYFNGDSLMLHCDEYIGKEE